MTKGTQTPTCQQHKLCLAVVSAKGALVTSSGTPILTDLPGLVTAAPSADGQAVVLGTISATGPASLFDTAVGKLACKRFLALSRTSIWWMTPAWGSTAADIPGETQFLLLELTDGSFGLLLPLIDNGKFRGTLRRPRSGSDDVIIRMESGNATVLTEECTGALLVAASRDPYELLQRGVTAAAALSGTAKHRSSKPVPPSVDVFGWCTWDAMYSKVNAAAIQEGLKALVDGGAPPKLLIIDDGWQQTDVDPVFRHAAASSGCYAGGIGMGDHLEAAKRVEEAAAALLSSPDNNMDKGVHATHTVQLEVRANGSASNTMADKSGSNGNNSSSNGGLFSIVRSWLAAAYDALLSSLRQLEASFLLRCKSLIEAAPANSWQMRLFSTLATGPLKNLLLCFYAEASDHTRRLVSVKANSKFSRPDAGSQFPLNSTEEDLRSVVAHLKKQHGVQYVYAWHAMMGFWGGLSAGEREMAKYRPWLITPVPSPSLLEVDPAIAWVQPVLSGVCLPADPRPLHNDMHAYLAGCGVDGVKVDVQSTIGVIGSSAGSGPALSAEYHASLEASALKHFGPSPNVINCMCHSTDDLYRMELTNLARVSDDFYPLNKPSHLAHIANCSFNTLFMGEVVIPDWDMMHSKHSKALLHATARAVSGGPFYVSDRPGHHDFAMLRRMVLPDGSVLRCQLPGRPTADCLFADVSHDGKTVLKVWNSNPCTGVVALFNIQGAAFSRALRRFHTHDASPAALTAVVSPADVPTLQGAAELFAVYSDARKEFELLRPNDTQELTVAGNGGSDVLTISPVLEAGDVRVAPLGLVGMLNSGGAVLSCTLSGGEVVPEASQEEEKAAAAAVAVNLSEALPLCTLRIKGGGAFLCYASHKPAAVLVEGREIPFTYDATKAALTFDVPFGATPEQESVIQF